MGNTVLGVVYVHGFELPVILVPTLVVEGSVVAGSFNINEGICIREELSDPNKRSTLLHEIAHAIITLGTPPERRNDEHVLVYAIETGWFSVLTDPRNAWVLDYVVRGKLPTASP